MSSNVYSLASIVIIAINIVFIITAVFIERKKPIHALSWVLTLLFLPLIGFILYLLFGRNLRLKKKKFCVSHSQNYKICQEINGSLEKAYYNELDFNEIYNSDIKQLIKLNINSSKSNYSNDNNVTVFTSAQDKYQDLLAEIDAAKVSIHMLYFIIQNDYIGRRIINLLAKKAKEGISVKLLFDHGNNLFNPFKAYKQILENGGEVKSFFSNTVGNFLRVNFRNHRKIVVIDGSIGYIGGINIGDEYLGLKKKISPWRDTHLKVYGSCVYSLQLKFMEDWIYASKNTVEFNNIEKYFMPIPLEKKGSTGIQIVSSGPDSNEEEIKRAFIKMISLAKKRILIQTPYFVPDNSFLEALQNAAMSGVEVILQIPAVPDKRVVYKTTLSFVADIIEYGIKVYLYPGFLHAKMITIDDCCCTIGTANIDMRSFSLNFEINAIMYGEEITNKCIEIFSRDLKKCTLLNESEFNRRSIISKIEENIFRLISPLL